MNNGLMSSAQNQLKHFNQLNHLHFHKNTVQELRGKPDSALMAVRKIFRLPDNADNIFYPAGFRKPESRGTVNSMCRKIAHNLVAHQKNKVRKHQNIGDDFQYFFHVHFEFP